MNRDHQHHHRRRPAVRALVLGVVLAMTAAVTGAVTAGAAEKAQATEVGVTPTEIHIAVVADVDNPFAPGVFKPSVEGVQGVAKYINATGGLAGRKVVVDFYDSKLNANEARNATINACENDLAIVGPMVGPMVLFRTSPICSTSRQPDR